MLRGSYHYDIHRDLALIEAIKTSYPAGTKPAQRGFPGVRAIFVLGLPRSGSTLIERILTSHSQVGSIGESPAFGLALGAIAQAAGVDANDGLRVASASRSFDPAAIGRHYAELTAPWRGQDACFVDKLPNNHLHAGLILEALPDARVVHIVRDPIANLYGIYKTLFNQAYPYSYDLDELVAYYNAYRGLMAHWRSVCGDRLIEVSYEELVEQPESVTRQLLADCGLPWQPECLDFHENPRPCTTQSASQIRAPLNRDGIEGWRRFKGELAPLRARLAGWY